MSPMRAMAVFDGSSGQRSKPRLRSMVRGFSQAGSVGLKRDKIANHRQGLGKTDRHEIARKRENIALGVGAGVEPAPVVVDHDDDVVVAPEFDGPARTLFPVYREALMLQHGCAAHPGAQLSMSFFPFHFL
jgi:hypothetical protein